MTITFENKNRYACGAMGVFVFTVTGTTTYDLSPYMIGYSPVGMSFSAGAAGDYATIVHSTKVVTTAASNSMSIQVFALKAGPIY